MFISFFRAPTAGAPSTAFFLESTLFYHPMGQAYDNTRELEYQVQLGSKLSPEYPMKSIAETFTQLRKSVGISASPIHSFHFDAEKYRSTTFIAAIDFEKALQVSCTGTSTRAGDLLAVKVKGANAADFDATTPNKLFLTLHADVILQISASGVFIYD